MSKYDVIIIGAGPGGIFAAYELMQKAPELKVAVFEAGNPLEKRKCPIDGKKVKSCINCKTCAIMSGFGGAGAFSDGKYNITNSFGGTLYEYIGKEEAIRLMEYVDDINVEFGGAGTKMYSTSGTHIKKLCMQNKLNLLDASVRHLGTDINYVVLENLYAKSLKRDDTVFVDFGDHAVGYVTLELSKTGSHQDAPVYFYLKFGERLEEMTDKTADYDGWLSRGWIQEEYIHVDVLPAKVKLPRRYSFRYMELRVIDTSAKFQLKIDGISCDTVSAVDMESVKPVDFGDPLLNQIDLVSRKTLKECMQDVFEDGPKRDRRMWLGDLRLQARANYYTFKNYDLAKRCMYIFAGLLFNEGKLSACVFTEPEMEPDDTYLLDYALFFSSVLLDYYEATGDLETLRDLYDVAIDQIRIAMTQLNEKNVVEDLGDAFWCFLDWGDGLNKQAGATAVLIYCIRYGIRLAKILDKQEDISWLEEKQAMLKEAAVKEFWDEELGMFVSGPDRQASWATQIWMILARVFDKETNCKLIHHVMEVNPRIRMVTPYMYHHYIDALIRCDEKELALEEMKRYWGEMIRDGADTFWELYNPYNREESPYGSSMVNSYCHAWSCTPTYFLRKFYMDNGK